tara:strand:+ start:163 stop:819 length:657 start_codon:yes stop_codon:yes gene_type:complete
MAVNEHKNLDDANRHNPKGYEVATNDTVLSKDNTPGSTTTDGALVWLAKSAIKVVTPTFRGYASLLENYQFPSSYDNNNKAPFQIDEDYGSATISSGTTVAQKKFFKISSCMLTGNVTINSAVVQVASNDTNALTIALVKYTPAAALTSYPVVLFEESITPSTANLDAVNIATVGAGDFDLRTATKGDHLFIMVKANAAGGVADNILVSVTAEIGYNV